MLRGWGDYFRTGNAEREFNNTDDFVVKRLRCWGYQRGPFTGDQLYGMGLHNLKGTVKSPSQATPRG